MFVVMVKGDEVVMSGGFVGKVMKVIEGYIGVEIVEGIEIIV